MRVLGIDPGTQCGWAVLEDGHRVASGVWDLKSRRHEGGGMRFLRFEAYLTEAVSRCDLVAYEEVAHHKGTAASHVYGGLVAILQAECEKLSLPYTGIPVGTAKRRATGKGNAGKPAMVSAAREKWNFDCEDDNEADALWVATCALESVKS